MKTKNKKIIAVLSGILGVAAILGGSTLAYLVTSTDSVENIFTPAKVTIELDEEFDGNEKKEITVTNTGDIDAYIRVRLVNYWIYEETICAEYQPESLAVELADEWFLGADKCYYYKYKIPAGETTPDMLKKPLVLKNMEVENFHGISNVVLREVVEVFAEAIQANPEEAVEEAWPAVDVDTDGNLALAAN